MVKFISNDAIAQAAKQISDLSPPDGCEYAIDVVGCATQVLGLQIHFEDLEALTGEKAMGLILPKEHLILCDSWSQLARKGNTMTRFCASRLAMRSDIFAFIRTIWMTRIPCSFIKTCPQKSVIALKYKPINLPHALLCQNMTYVLPIRHSGNTSKVRAHL